MLDTIIMRSGKIFKPVMNYIPQVDRPEFRRLLAVLEGSGAEPFTALIALFRWTAGRPQYAAIHKGLQDYFLSEVKQLCS